MSTLTTSKPFIDDGKVRVLADPLKVGRVIARPFIGGAAGPLRGVVRCGVGGELAHAATSGP